MGFRDILLNIIDADRVRVLDWDRIAATAKSSGCSRIEAGIIGDWGTTCDTVFENGLPVMDSQCHTWTTRRGMTPGISVDGAEPVPCFTEKWGCDMGSSRLENRPWPTRALSMLPPARPARASP